MGQLFVLSKVKSLIEGGVIGRIVMLVRLEQPAKAATSILVTLYGIVILARVRHPSKAPYPMLVKLLGNSTVVKLRQS